MSVSAKFNLILSVVETLALGLDEAPDTTTTHDLKHAVKTLGATSTPPATQVWSDKRTLAAGTDTFDLAALPGPLGTTLDFTGLKVQLALFQTDPANTSPITVKPAAANGYDIFGSAGEGVILNSLGTIGDIVMVAYDEFLPDVAAAEKDITVTSAMAAAIYRVILVAG